MPTATLRPEAERIVGLADDDLERLFRLIASGVSAEEALRDLLPALIAEYGSLSAAAAAEWYDEQREAAEVGGNFTALPVDATDRGAQALIGWAVKSATDDLSLRTLILGGVQRRVVDHARLTVASNAVDDPQARGWQRVTSGRGCEFCSMLAGRGAVYSDRSADFASHDHCHCAAVPAWRGRPVPVKPYEPSLRSSSDADRARVRDWIANH